jgi:hypothetical protein
MVFASAFASFVYPINIAVYFAIFLYVAIKERLTRCGSGGKDDIARKDYQDRHTQYPYTLLKMYDLVLLWNNFSAWDINHAQLQKFFDANVSKCHLDVGVGSGYYVSLSSFEVCCDCISSQYEQPSHSKKLQKICKQDSMTLELWDLNAPPLKYASARIKDACDSSLTISTRQVNLLEDHVKQSGPTRFTTASMNYVFHCVVYPQMDGNVSKEEQAIEKFYRGFSQAKTVMTEGGTISGTTSMSRVFMSRE